MPLIPIFPIGPQSRSRTPPFLGVPNTRAMTRAVALLKKHHLKVYMRHFLGGPAPTHPIQLEIWHPDIGPILTSQKASTDTTPGMSITKVGEALLQRMLPLLSKKVHSVKAEYPLIFKRKTLKRAAKRAQPKARTRRAPVYAVLTQLNPVYRDKEEATRAAVCLHGVVVPIRSVLPQAQVGCRLDTDGDGNCPLHPDGCHKADHTDATRVLNEAIDAWNASARTLLGVPGTIQWSSENP